METLYDRYRNNNLIFTKLLPQKSPERADDNPSSKEGGPARNTEFEENFSRRNLATVTRPTPIRRPPDVSSCGDGTELDSDLDECRSELGSEIFSEAGNVTRRHPRLNRLMNIARTPSLASSLPAAEQIKTPETPNDTLVASEPANSPLSVKSLASELRVNTLCGKIHWNLVTILSVALGFLITELVLKQTVKLLESAKGWIETAGNFLWNKYLAVDGAPSKGSSKILGMEWRKPGTGTLGAENILLLAFVVPTVLLLAVVYAIVWILYFLNVVLLTEIPL